jgi:hypothetical protein
MSRRELPCLPATPSSGELRLIIRSTPGIGLS